MHRIIVATDGSTTANRAIDAGASLAKATGADLVLLTIGGSVTGAELRDLASTAGDLSDTMQSAADKIFETGAKTRPAPGRSLRDIANRLGRSRRRDYRGGATVKSRFAGCRTARPKSAVRPSSRQRIAKTGKLCAMRRYGRSITYSTCAALVSA